MKRFLMTMVFAVAFMATTVQAANDKIYFTDSTGLSITNDLDFQYLDVSSNPGKNAGDVMDYKMSRFHVGSVEIDEANEIASPIDADLSVLTFMPNGYYDIEIENSPLTPYIGAGLGLVSNEIDAGPSGSVDNDKKDLGYQFMVGLGFDVKPTTVLTGEYRFLGIAGSDVYNTHAFIFGARFMF